MKYLLTAKDDISRSNVGGKAYNFLSLEKLGARVPRWTVLPNTILTQQLSETNNWEEVKTEILNAKVPDGILDDMQEVFGSGWKQKTYAIRSSSMDEDGMQFSFAGQFSSTLNVYADDVIGEIKTVWLSSVSDRIIKYRKENQLPINTSMSVIIQEMVDSDVSGVAFGMDPVSGETDTKIISSLFGLGEGLVSGELDADTYTVKPKKVLQKIANKTEAYKRNTSTGIQKVSLSIEQQKITSLSKNQIAEITQLLDKLQEALELPQDIEFAYHDDKLYLLQTRPITVTKNNRTQENYILWDNSNIIESYPGITTPLTFSFIIKMYERVYRQFVGIMGVKEKEVDQHASVFANTLGLVRGRVYYNLLNWYKMLAMLPGYAINAENMERMMGVKEKFELDDSYQMSKELARLRIVGMVVKMLMMQITLPRKRKLFKQHLDQTMKYYDQIAYETLKPEEIIGHYQKFETTLLLEWKAPLINDFFAMIWFGALKKKVEKYYPDEPNLHNDLLCGSQDIISVEPIHKSIAISKQITADPAAKKFFLEAEPNQIWRQLVDGKFPKIKDSIDSYLDLFGNRCMGELKLETISYHQDPTQFIKIIASYVRQNISEKTMQGDIETQLRGAAESKIDKVLKGKPIQRWWFGFITRKVRDLVSNRENLRYERTRGFGMVRTLFTALGKQWHAQGELANPRDIFYLELAEIKASSAGFDKGLKEKIESRKTEFEGYKNQKPPEERFFTYGNVFTDEFIYSHEKIEAIEEELTGIGCCPGKVRGKVKVVQNPNDIDSLNGDILVTTSTDPGWVTLFPTASAILVEKGSLLSHSAIVSREMGIPCIVSISGLIRTLKTGDEVVMDGSTGKISVINRG